MKTCEFQEPRMFNNRLLSIPDGSRYRDAVRGSARPTRTSKVVDCIAALTAAERPPDTDGDVVGDEARGAVAHDSLDTARMATARGHHRGRTCRSNKARWIQWLGRITLAAGIETIGNRAVGTLVTLKDGSA